jgi:hypothetical protein
LRLFEEDEGSNTTARYERRGRTLEPRREHSELGEFVGSVCLRRVSPLCRNLHITSSTHTHPPTHQPAEMTGITHPHSFSASPSAFSPNVLAAIWKWFCYCLHSLLSSLGLEPAVEHKPQPTKFVVLAHQRTGSNWLCGILHQHAQIHMHNELFNEMRPLSYHEPLGLNWTYETRDAHPRAFLDFIWGTSPEKKTCVGFKSFPEHWLGREDVRDELLKDQSVKKIIFKREDAIAVFFSEARARTTGSYVTREYAQVKVNLDVPKLNRHVLEYQEIFENYERMCAGQNIFRLTYEQLDCEKTHDQVLKSKHGWSVLLTRGQTCFVFLVSNQTKCRWL